MHQPGIRECCTPDGMAINSDALDGSHVIPGSTPDLSPIDTAPALWLDERLCSAIFSIKRMFGDSADVSPSLAAACPGEAHALVTRKLDSIERQLANGEAKAPDQLVTVSVVIALALGLISLAYAAISAGKARLRQETSENNVNKRDTHASSGPVVHVIDTGAVATHVDILPLRQRDVT